VDHELTSRLMAAYQFIALHRGDAVSLADLRLHMATVEAHLLNPVLRHLNGRVVDFWAVTGDTYETGVLELHAAPQGASWRELDDGVEIDGVTYTALSVRPCG
jgi:hypothetical protein